MIKKPNKNSPSKKSKRLSVKSGLPSESFVYVGEDRDEPISITNIEYKRELIKNNSVSDINSLKDVLNSENNFWIKVEGVHHSDTIVQLCNIFDIHPLIQEDILNTHQRTKIEEFDNYLFITFKHLYTNESNLIVSEQISVVVGQNYLISFQETHNKVFDDLQMRIESSVGSVRQKNIDYLLYKILDTIVDEYFVLIDQLGDNIEDIETEITHKPNSRTSFKIQELKKNLMLIGKNIQPMRDTLNKIISGNHRILESKNQNYFKDVFDHAFLVSENIENQKSLLSDLMNIYLVSMSNKLNQVMKVLTIISTIFMPLSFITGIFGMNFTHFPGMTSPYGYYLFWFACIIIVGFMLLYFKIKKWF
jgi:magnesium transporter